MADLGFGHDHRCLTVCYSTNLMGLVIAVEGIERNRQPRATRVPFGPNPDGAVRDVAQRAMPTTKAGADPVGDLAAQRAVGVVYADQSDDALRRG